MTPQTLQWQGSWIWTPEETPLRNAFVRFRRRFDYAGGAAALHLTADSRYALWVNGEYVGFGPVRAWTAHWRYDTYDLAPYLVPGENVIAVEVQHFGEGNFQYLPAPPGLLAQLEVNGQILGTDEGWRAAFDPAFILPVPRISVQEGFEEQYDARLGDDWTALGYADSAWPAAIPLRTALGGPHQDLQPRGIPFLTQEAVLPQRLVSAERVRSLPHRWTIYAKPYLTPQDFTSNHVITHAFLVTQIWSAGDAEVRLFSPHKGAGPVKLNGVPVEGEEVRLKAGWNSLAVSLRGWTHLPEYVFCLDGPPDILSEVRFCAAGELGGSPWAVLGPFAPEENEWERAQTDIDAYLKPVAARVPSATAEAGAAFWKSGDVALVAEAPYFQPVGAEHLPPADVFVQAYTDSVVPGTVSVEGSDALLSGSGWTTITPPEDGGDVRLLLDWGRELVGLHRFQIVAPAGTIVDLHNFEFIQPDGRYNFADGMNNSSRYVCREGRQTYQTWTRRGFGLSYLILRGLTGPVQIGRVETIFSTYPQTNRGQFACSDAQLDRIWAVGAHTLRCCAEDTYTDCPTYEQTHWVGDARNEALIDWVINGDPRLWFRCLEQTAQSLDRSPLTESHVPSSWENILPAWSFLWMRSCREYYLFTGDRERSQTLLDYLARNVNGIRQHLDARGLFSIHAWNMFDWAAMDTPSGVVTHQNCFAVHALRDCAELADWLGQPDRAGEWRTLADSLSEAINAHLWNDTQQAYTDCLRGDEHSPVFSQQTQTVAVMSGVAQGERAERCRAIIHHPPDGFVLAGSPFFEFFLLEAYQQEGREADFLQTIRRDWGFMVDKGATTFWEMWSNPGDRLTRSHCHGWSAAPTYFLSAYVLGVSPGGPGFSPILIAPHPGDLKWCRGIVPTPSGDISVQWENDPGQPFTLRVLAPEGLDVRVTLPRSGTVTINGKSVENGETN